LISSINNANLLSYFLNIKRIDLYGGESSWGLFLYVKKNSESIWGHFGDFWEIMAFPNLKSPSYNLSKMSPNGFGIFFLHICKKSPQMDSAPRSLRRYTSVYYSRFFIYIFIFCILLFYYLYSGCAMQINAHYFFIS
jgi:hypothetical protein